MFEIGNYGSSDEEQEEKIEEKEETIKEEINKNNSLEKFQLPSFNEILSNNKIGKNNFSFFLSLSFIFLFFNLIC